MAPMQSCARLLAAAVSEDGLARGYLRVALAETAVSMHGASVAVSLATKHLVGNLSAGHPGKKLQKHRLAS